MKSFIYILLAFSIFPADNFAQSLWTRKADFPDIRYNAAAFSIGGKGYAGTGLTPEARKNDFWEYDPVSNTWTPKASLPSFPREGAAGFSIDEKGYIGGGLTDSLGFITDFWEYDPQTDRWTQKADIPIQIGSQNTLVSFSIGDRGYVRAAYNDDDFWEYDPGSDQWTKKANFPGEARLNQSAFAIGLKGYIGTGFAGTDYSSELWEYDPAADQWTQKAVFPGAPRSGAVAFAAGGKGYIGLGNAFGTFPQDFWAYDPEQNIWTESDSCGYGAEGAFAFSIGSKGYVGTGIFADVGHFWEFNSTGATTVNEIHHSAEKFELQQNYPNPFNPATIITFHIPAASAVTLKIFDPLGRELQTIVNEYKQEGAYTITFNASNLPNGIYYYQLKADQFISSKSMMLLK